METWRAVGETHERTLEGQSQRFGEQFGAWRRPSEPGTLTSSVTQTL